MQGQGQQPGLLPGAAGFPAMNQAAMQALLGQGGQIPGMQGHAILAQRLAVLPAGGRGQGYRGAAGAQMPMGVMMKPAARKGSASSKGRKSCNCKNSKCLKLYCECFASGRYCDSCNCLNCLNNKDNEAVRQSAVESILERNPNAFRPKIQTAEGDTHPHSVRNAPDGTVRHTKGCNCKKSSCLKKYCECFQGGIFCTQICKCVDCKNFDGSEARAQVISHHGDPSFGMSMQQQQGLKRPRMQMQQQQQQQQQSLLQAQGLSAGLLQQQLVAAAGGASAAAAAAAALQPLQQLHALAGLSLPPVAPLTSVSAPLAAMAAAAGGASSLTHSGSTAALQQLPSRPPMLDAMHDLVKPELVEEICSLLLIVAKEEADKHKNAAAAIGGQQQQEQQEQQPGDGSGLALAIKAEPADATGGLVAAGEEGEGEAGEAQCNGLKRKRGSGAEEGDEAAAGGDEAAAAAKRAHTSEQQQQDGVVAGQQQSQLYVAQEGVVLQEFNSILQRILAQAEKKTTADAEAEAAAAMAAAVAAADGAMAGLSAEDQAAAAAAAAAASALFGEMGGGDGSGVDQHALLQQMAESLQAQQQQQMEALQQQQQQIEALQQQQQQQDVKPTAGQLAAQQALLMQAAAGMNGGNLALLNASRGLYGLPNASQQQQQQQQQLVQPLLMAQAAAGNGGGLRPAVGGLPQMIPVVLQDGSVHQVPAQTLMQLQLATGGLQQQQQQQQLGAAVQAPGAGQQAVPAAAAAAAAGGSGAAVAQAVQAAQQQPISLLSLLNGSQATPGNSG